MSNTVVHIADLKLVRGSGGLITYALGSCIGITLYDPQIKLASLLHIMLPRATSVEDAQSLKFADTGIRVMLKKMQLLGGNKARYICKIAGGAKMFAGFGAGDMANIGARNIETVKALLARENIRISGTAVGENFARTMIIDAETGVVTIKTIGKPEVNI